MSDLPAGWEWATLGEIADSVKNGIFVSRPGIAIDGVPILRISSVRALALSMDEIRYSGLSERELRDQDALLEPEDLLFTRYSGTADYVGVCAAVPESLGALTYPDKLIRARLPKQLIDARYLALAFASPIVRTQVKSVLRTTAGQVGISGKALKAVPIPIAPLPEQRRIVANLEDHISRLDAASASISRAIRRTRNLAKQIIIGAVPMPGPAHWKVVKVDEAGQVDLGRQRHPDWHTGPNMRPYLRVANVFEDRIDTEDVMEMDFPPNIFDRFCLAEGDILLNEGQSPEYLGRPAMYRGAPKDVAFTNSLLRFRAGPDVDPEWALLVFRRHLHAKRFMREVRITTNIAHLSATRFKSVEFPIPPMIEQKRIVAETADKLAYVSRLNTEINIAHRKNSSLRRSLLEAAFDGRLSLQKPDDEPASALLDRIRANHSTTPKAKRGQRNAKKTGEASPAQERLP